MGWKREKLDSRLHIVSQKLIIISYIRSIEVLNQNQCFQASKDRGTMQSQPMSFHQRRAKIAPLSYFVSSRAARPSYLPLNVAWLYLFFFPILHYLICNHLADLMASSYSLSFHICVLVTRGLLHNTILSCSLYIHTNNHSTLNLILLRLVVYLKIQIPIESDIFVEKKP